MQRTNQGSDGGENTLPLATNPFDVLRIEEVTEVVPETEPTVLVQTGADPRIMDSGGFNNISYPVAREVDRFPAISLQPGCGCASVWVCGGGEHAQIRIHV